MDNMDTVTAVEAAPVSIDNLPSIISGGVLLALNMSVWEAAKKDKNTEEEVRVSKGASSKRAATVRKHLFAECPALDNIKALRGEARLWFNKATLEWNSPFRYCPTASYFEVVNDYNNLKARFNNLVNIFLGVYSTEISKQAFVMGSLFNPNEYPPVEEVARKFRFELDEGPVPLATDFRVNIQAEALKEMQERCERHTKERIELLMKDQWNRIRERVEHIRDRMDAVLKFVPGEVEEEMIDVRVEVPNDDPDVGKTFYEGTDDEYTVPATKWITKQECKITKKRRPKLHDSMLDHGIELCELLKQFNVTNDPALEEARKMLKDALIHVDMKGLKESPAIQSTVKNRMQDILDKFNF